MTQKKARLEVDIEGLLPNHVRLIKALHNGLLHVLKTDNEADYLNHSAEAIRLCASLIKQAHFAEATKSHQIPYADQVLEFSLDTLQEYMIKAKVVTYDC